MNCLWFSGWAIAPDWLSQQLVLLGHDDVERQMRVAPAHLADQAHWVQEAKHDTAPRWWCGWSMGGLRALEVAKEDQACQGVIIVCGTPQFTQNDDWSFGLKAVALKRMLKQFQQSPETTLQRFYQQISLGEPETEDCFQALKEQSLPWALSNIVTLKHQLNFLANRDFRAQVTSLNKPIYFLLGQHDPLLSITAVVALESLSSCVRVMTLPGVGHVPFASHRGRSLLRHAFAQCCKQLCTSSGNHPYAKPLKKTTPQRHSFDKGAGSYAQVSSVQRVSARRLMTASPTLSDQHKIQVLDLGCGTGFLGQLIHHRYSQQLSTVCGIDVAENMLKVARAHQIQDARQVFVQGCLNKPGVGEAALLAPWDMLVSNFAWHWLEQPAKRLQQWLDCLKPGGWLGLAMPVDGSLSELAQAWQSVDNYSHIHRFVEWPIFLDQLLSCSMLEQVSQWEETFHTEHGSLFALRQALRQLGAPPVAEKVRPGLLGKRAYRQLTDKLDSFRNARGNIALTYRVGFLWAQKVTKKLNSE